MRAPLLLLFFVLGCRTEAPQVLVHINADLVRIDRYEISVVGPFGTDSASLVAAPGQTRVFGVAPRTEAKETEIRVTVEAKDKLGVLIDRQTRVLADFQSGVTHHFFYFAARCALAPEPCGEGLVCSPCGCEPPTSNKEGTPPNSWSQCAPEAPDAGSVDLGPSPDFGFVDLGGPPVDVDAPDAWAPADAGVFDLGREPPEDPDDLDASLVDMPILMLDAGLENGREDAAIVLRDHGPNTDPPHGRFDAGDIGPRPDFGGDVGVDNGRDLGP